MKGLILRATGIIGVTDTCMSSSQVLKMYEDLRPVDSNVGLEVFGDGTRRRARFHLHQLGSL